MSFCLGNKFFPPDYKSKTMLRKKKSLQETLVTNATDWSVVTLEKAWDMGWVEQKLGKCPLYCLNCC